MTITITIAAVIALAAWLIYEVRNPEMQIEPAERRVTDQNGAPSSRH